MKNELTRCALVLCLFLLAACGAAPTVSTSQIVGAHADKLHAMQVWYRVAQLTTTSSSSYGRGYAPVADMGLGRFGPLVAQQATPVFAQRGVTITGTRVIEEGDKSRANTEELRNVGVLFISPKSGRIQATNHATSASYVFTAYLLDPQTHRVTWRANVDTSTWAGTDIVMRNIDKTTFDEAYAARLLKALADQMQQDGMI